MKSKNKNRRKVRVMHLICDASERAIVSIHTDANTKRANIEYVLPIEFPTQIEAMCEIETPTYGTCLGIALTNKMLLLIKDTKILSSKKLFPEPVTCMAFDGTYLWAITALSNEVIKIHPDTGETSVVMKLYPPSVYAPSTECYTMRYIQDSMWIFTDTRQYVVKISIKPPHICTLVNPNPFRVSTNSAQDTVIYLPTTCSLVTLNPDLAKIVNLKEVPKNTIAYNERTNTYVVPYNTNPKLKHIIIIPFETGLMPTACVCVTHMIPHTCG